MTKTERLDALVAKERINSEGRDLALGYLRYEAIRNLNLLQFGKLYELAMAGENFDDMVDDLILEERKA